MPFRSILNLKNPVLCVALLLGCACAPVSASSVFAVWNSAGGTTAAGTLGGVSFSMTGLTNALLTTANLSTGFFSANPGSSSQQALQYAQKSNYTVTFAAPISVLYVYDDFWRPEDLATYSFSQAIQILSGNATATVQSGDDLVATSPNSFLDVIVELTNVTSFTVTSNFSDPSAQILDFAGQPAILTGVPEPGSSALMAVAVVFRFSVKWRGERSPLVSIPPLRGGDIQGIRVYRSDVSFG